MDLNEKLRNMRSQAAIAPREEKIQETIQRTQAQYCRQEQGRLLTYQEFLWTQLHYTRKRWWALQAGLLMLACLIVPGIESHFYRLRSIGVIGCLFVVLMIPELWRNKESDSIQVEAACLYSLRQIYAARITLFGIVDVAFLTAFGFGLGRLGFTFTEVLSQFLLPVTVTACICFSFLCGKRNPGEMVSLAACLIWGGIWLLILMNEEIYAMIVSPVWAVLLGSSLVFLAASVRRAVQTTNQYWEVAFA